MSHTVTDSEAGATRRTEDPAVGEATSAREAATEPPSDERVAVMVRTLIGNGFTIDGPIRKPHYLAVRCSRFDEFGTRQTYALVLPETALEEPDVRSIQRNATLADGGRVVLIQDETLEGVPCMSWSQFLARLGGPVKSWLPLQPDFKDTLIELGHNRPVLGLVGKPDDLFEEYVHVGLQFLLSTRVHRYGQERRFEARPDGVGFLTTRRPFIYDAKAYGNGFSVSLDDVRRFADYVRWFDRSYRDHVGQVVSFLVISGSLEDSLTTMQERCSQLIAECGVPLCYVAADVLGEACELLTQHPMYRTVLDWQRLLVRHLLTMSDIRSGLEALRKDRVIE